jgi:hypothetical protein
MTAALDKTTARHSAALHLALWTMLPAVGILAGLVLRPIPSWIAALPLNIKAITNPRRFSVESSSLALERCRRSP